MSTAFQNGRDHIRKLIQQSLDEIKHLESLDIDNYADRQINELKIKLEHKYICLHENHLEWKALRHMLAQRGECPPDTLKECEEYADKMEYKPACFSWEEVDALIAIPTLEGRREVLYAKINEWSQPKGDTQS